MAKSQATFDFRAKIISSYLAMLDCSDVTEESFIALRTAKHNKDNVELTEAFNVACDRLIKQLEFYRSL